LSQIKKFAGQAFVYGLSSIIPRFLSYLLVPIYARIFLPNEYGVIADLYAIVAILNIIVTYGMETAFFKFSNQSEFRNVYSTAFFSLLFSSSLFLFLGLIFNKNIAAFIDYSGNPEYIVYFILIIFFDAICAIPFVKLRNDNKALKFATLKILNVVVNVALNVVLLIILPWMSGKFHVFHFELNVKYVFIANLISSLFVFLTLIKDFPIKFKFDFRLWKKMMVYAFPLLIAGLAGMINDNIDRQFIKYLSPVGHDAMSDLGIYFANLKIAVILVVFTQTFRFAAEPFFFKRQEDKSSKDTLAQVMKFFILVCLVVVLFTMANISIFKYYIGEKYWSGLSIVPVVLGANVLVGVYVNLSIWYKLSGKTMYGVYFIVFGCLLTIILNYFLVPVYGYQAAAYNRFISYLLMVLLCYWFGTKNYSIPYDVKRIGKYLIIFLVGLFIILFLNSLHLSFLIVVNNLLLVIFVYWILKSENLWLVTWNYVKNLKKLIIK